MQIVPHDWVTLLFMRYINCRLIYKLPNLPCSRAWFYSNLPQWQSGREQWWPCQQWRSWHACDEEMKNQTMLLLYRCPWNSGLHHWNKNKGAKNKNPPVDVLPIFDSPKEHDAGEGVAEEQQEHANDDEEALVHADDHRQQQHLQRDLHSEHRQTVQWLHREPGFRYRVGISGKRCSHMLSAYGEEPEDNHAGAHHVGVGVLQENRKRFIC